MVLRKWLGLALLLAACNAGMPEERAFVEKAVSDVRAGGSVPLAIPTLGENDETKKAVAAIRESQALTLDKTPTGSPSEACFNGNLAMKDGRERAFGIRLQRKPLGVIEMTAEHECLCQRKGATNGSPVQCSLRQRVAK
jgi:hypothetical protein